MKALSLLFLLLLLGAALYAFSASQGAHSTQAESTSDVVTGDPTISAGFINDLLCAQSSPACGDGQALYDDGTAYGIDPAFALAIYWNESNFGRAGEARVSKSLGNLRCLDQQHYGDLGTWCQDGYAWFPTWQAGFQAFYRLIAGPLYVQSGRTTIEAIIPRYAPSGDGNSPEHYIATVRACIALWRAGKEQVPS